MKVDDFVKSPGSWLSMERNTGIVISSRVRLARNMKDVAFPAQASDDERVRLCNELREICKKMSTVANPLFLDMGSLEPVDKEVLKERHLISNELSEKGAGSGLIVAEDERIAIMINEEDHFRLQAMSPGMDIPAVWAKIDAVDSELESYVNYAFSPRFGYLTACPTNVGTGLRASVMMHLPGLKLMNEIEPVIKGLNRIGFEVRGLLGEGTEAWGDMFQISNQTTLGETEDAIITRLIQVTKKLVYHEQNARARSMEQKKFYVLDHVGRAFGILSYARVLSSREAIDMLSRLRLGIEFNIVKNVTVTRINEVMLLTQPGHLQRIAKKVLNPEERDELRANVVRQKLKGISMLG